ncbi:Cytochrome p450 [Aspergillus sclerotialis]|uniref:Cytochrome p450 n=1 Tax=Aspergillus sclerotialis TaxID=2070753 RepID=A0A3A3A806_9EURO|nr:Cytochrome p450 [Aspergillus sclerotialis]
MNTGKSRKGRRLFLKDPSLYQPTPNGTDAIITANEKNHARVRRLLAHAFSSKALYEQETLLHTYADLLVQKVHEQIATSSAGTRVIDINQWYNFTTFDLIGDLAFGEPFQCLENEQYHWWVSLMFDAVRLSVYLKLLWFFPFLSMLLKLPLPRYLAERRNASFQLSVEKVARRLQRQTDRPDFMSYILKHNKGRYGLSTAEIEANAATFVLAGSETTSALLSGCTYYLLTNPTTYTRLVHEIRGAFERQSDIKLSSIATLPYLNAVLEESMRIYPPIPTMLPRIVPAGGAIINGQFVPEGTSVAISLWSTLHSSTHFTDADSFLPERWLANDPTSKFALDNKDAFQPFSYGPRNCLGQHLANAEMRLILTKVLYNFDLELLSESNDWAKQEMYNLWSRPALKVRVFRAGSR